MTPLHLRRRLRSALTILAGDDPDLTAHANAWQEAAYAQSRRAQELEKAHADTLSAHYRVVGELDGIRAGLCTDGDTRDALRHVSAVLDDAGVSIPNCDRGQGCTSYHLTHRIHALADERDALRTELATGAAHQALDAIAAACGCAEWEYPGQVVRDVEAVVRERDEAVALISTVRAELAAAVEGRDRLRAAIVPFVGFTKGTRPDLYQTDWNTLAAVYDRMFLKRKRTKEERAEKERERLARMWSAAHGTGWAIREALRGGPLAARDLAEIVALPYNETREEAVALAQRAVSDLARAGYLTVAKGPGGVRVYSLKEAPE